MKKVIVQDIMNKYNTTTYNHFYFFSLTSGKPINRSEVSNNTRVRDHMKKDDNIYIWV